MSQLPIADLLPQAVRNSILFRKGGYDIYEGLVDQQMHQLLLKESVDLSVSANVQEVTEKDTEDYRGGRPERRLKSVAGGPVLKSFYDADWVLRFLRQTTGLELMQSGGQGSYSYYSRPGDFLSLHRDIVSCEVTMITSLYNNALNNEGGKLCLYPNRIFEPLSSIRRTLCKDAIEVHLLPGQSLIFLGGLVPHLLTPVQHETRIVSLLCYKF